MPIVRLGESCPHHHPLNESKYYIMIIYSINLNSPRTRRYLSGEQKNRSIPIGGLFPRRHLLCHGEGDDILKVSSADMIYINQIKSAQSNRETMFCHIGGRARFQPDSGNPGILGLDATNRPPGSRHGSKLILPKIRN